MVLLTSSAISVAISGFIICTFTFLLFLSGYVLQQRTVRSLQEALRQPPEPRPLPSLPAQFRKGNEIGDNEKEIDEVVVVVESGQLQKSDAVRTAVLGGSGIETLDSLEATERSAQATGRPHKQESLAYILTVSDPEDLCSAALFARQQRQSSTLTKKPAIVFLYPSTWETSPSSLHISALTFLRDIQDEYSLVYHPVDISAVWSGVGTNSQLLGELQRNRWDFDRVLYLRSPGMARDMFAIESVLQHSSTKNSWTPVTASAGSDPELLFWSRTKGLMMPRGEMRKLTLSATTSHTDHHVTEMDVEALAQEAAYVIFDDEELDHRRTEREWYGGLFSRFERDLASVCEGRGLLEGDRDKVDLRRRV
jgi:hypothetical protein